MFLSLPSFLHFDFSPSGSSACLPFAAPPRTPPPLHPLLNTQILSVSLLAASRPELRYRFIQQTLQPGPDVSLKCIAAGQPTPQIYWTLDGFPLPQNDR